MHGSVEVWLPVCRGGGGTHRQRLKRREYTGQQSQPPQTASGCTSVKSQWLYLQSTQPVRESVQLAAPQTPLSRCVIAPFASKKGLGRSRVATVIVSPAREKQEGGARVCQIHFRHVHTWAAQAVGRLIRRAKWAPPFHMSVSPDASSTCVPYGGRADIVHA